MKSVSKILAFFLVFIVSVCSLVACSDSKFKTANTENAPDYSNSTDEFTIWSYGATCNNWYQWKGVRYYFAESLQTEEHTRWYKEANFNLLFIDYTFQANTSLNSYDFENSELKEVMDMANEQGLKCIIFNNNIHALSNSTELRINPDKADGVNFFESEDAYAERVKYLLRGAIDHEAFYGVTLLDEAPYNKMPALGEIYKVIKKACGDKETFIMVNILPYADNSNSHKVSYCGSTDTSSEEAYQKYLETYYEYIGQYAGYVQYDDYPILSDNTVLSSYLYNQRVISEFCKEKGLKRHMVFQTCKYSNRRAPEEADMYFQLNLGQAFGTKNYSYYTYYPTVNTNDDTLPDETCYIVDRLGNRNPLYYSIQKLNAEMLFNSKALMNFEYKGMTYKTKTPVPGGVGYAGKLVENEMAKLSSYEFEVVGGNGGLVIITELYDEARNQYGYYVVNATTPAYSTEIKVTLKFEGFENTQIYQNARVNNVALSDNGEVNIYLGTGRGAFVMPY